MGGYSYIIFNNQKYFLNKSTPYKITKKLPKNKLINIKINGSIKNNQYGYGPNSYKLARTIIIKQLL